VIGLQYSCRNPPDI